jgi:hypothetical protein
MLLGEVSRVPKSADEPLTIIPVHHHQNTQELARKSSNDAKRQEYTR